MPFDGTAGAALNRRLLVDALRQEMPEGFAWDFTVPHINTSCGTAGCAVGLGIEMGIFHKKQQMRWEEVSGPLGIEIWDARAIFGGSRYWPLPLNEVTPAMVADALEALDK